ncbi:cell wall-binding repeat-containing protein [Clostridium sp.]|uniref:cell wall-binding repeat-containing protein n=1 Tax=Clostridium sp. TaxID=1506 RepID=UPI003F4C7556
MKSYKGFIKIVFFIVILSCGLINTDSIVLAQDTSAIRVFGSDRYSTSVAISQEGWSTATTVIIASGQDFPDALSASALCKSKDAPILLTDSKALSEVTIGEIQRLKATQAIIVGGTSVININIEKQLKTLGVTTSRVGGVDRYDTSKQVAKLSNLNNGIIIATGSDFPDALSIASVAGIKSMPILLSPKSGLDSNITDFIEGKNIPASYIVGGMGVLNSTIDSELPSSKRLSGKDRYATNLAVLTKFTDSLNFDTAYLVSGENFPDALCASALAAKNNAAVFLTDKNSISSDSISFLKSHNVKHIIIFGGTGVISQDVENTVESNISFIPTVDIIPTISLHDSLKSEIISNMENRTTTFDFKWKGSLQDCKDTANQILNELVKTNPYEYYTMISIRGGLTEENYEDITTTTLNFTVEYRTTKAQEDLVTAQINDIVPKLISNSRTTADKELAIHDWIVNNVKYDTSLTRYTPYDALVNHSAVCEGYALLAYRMLKSAGIQVKMVSGTANNGNEVASHAWNLVNIDGSWYHLDTTWDDPSSSRPILSHSYFNLTDDEISKDHAWDKALYPTVSKVHFIK